MPNDDALASLRAADVPVLRALLSDALRLQVLRRMQGTVRHDFVSPLQATSLTFDLLRRQAGQPSGPEQREQTTRLAEAGKAELERFKGGMSHVVDALATPERDQRFDLSRTVQELRTWMQNEAAFLGVGLEAEIPEEVWINGRREDVRQLIAVLMLYIIDGLTTGGRLSIRLEKGENAANTTLLAEGVKDPAQWGVSMFEPNWSQADLIKGIGVGIARWMARDLGGDIKVEVVSPANAVLHITLPYTR
jgi:C4-dicarboxylate-specific signal transduction histidine kinase